MADRKQQTVDYLNKHNLAKQLELAVNVVARQKPEDPFEFLANEVKKLSKTKPQVVFVLGGPGAGKGTQCAKIVEEFGYIHLSAGDLLRDERTKGGEMGTMIENYIKEGKIVPVEVTVNLIRKAMEQNVLKGKTNFLIDGFPRNQDNLDGWHRVMGGYAEIRFVLFFDCPESVMEARLLERGKSSGRSDDNIESIKKRFRTYVEETMPVLNSFDRIGKCRKLSAIPPPDLVYAHVRRLFVTTGKPEVVFVLGAPGVARKNLVERMSKDFGLVPLTVADLLQEERKQTTNDIATQIEHAVADHKTVVGEVSVGAIRKAIEAHVAKGKHQFVVSGFPRNQENIDSWNRVMNDSVDVRFVCYLQVPDSQLSTDEMMKKRLARFHEESTSVLSYFERKNKLRSIDASAASEDLVYAHVKRALDVLRAPLQTTFAFIKPDAVRNGSELSILNSIQQDGFEILSQRRVKLTAAFAGQFYAEHKGKSFFDALVGFMTSGPAIALALRKINAIKSWRELLGPTNSLVAREKAPNSLRGRFGTDGQKNACHGSDSVDSANRELELLFPGNLFSNYVGKRIIIAGPPAAGKGTQCDMIKNQYGVVHISTGDLLREAASAGTALGKEAKQYMADGKLVPDTLIINLVKERLEQSDCQEQGWLLDGFPRTKAQADALKDAGISAHKFVLLEVPDEALLERVLGRRQDPVTKKIYHLKFSPPESDEIKARLITREDDTEASIKVRIEQYHHNVAAVIDSYQSILVKVNGNQPAHQVFEHVAKDLQA